MIDPNDGERIVWAGLVEQGGQTGPVKTFFRKIPPQTCVQRRAVLTDLSDRRDPGQRLRPLRIRECRQCVAWCLQNDPILEYDLHGQGCQPSCENKCNVRSDPLAVHTAARVGSHHPVWGF